MSESEFVICIDNSEYPASLEVRKIYECFADDKAASAGMIRVVDESGEDYVYPAKYFVYANLPDDVSALLKSVA